MSELMDGDRPSPELKLIEFRAPTPRGAQLFNDNDREWLRDQIRSLRRIYHLEWFVRQELFGKYGLEDLTDTELLAFMNRMGEAVQCIRDNVPFEDRDLIRYTVDIDVDQDGGEAFGSDVDNYRSSAG